MALAVACANDDGGDDGAGTSSSGGGSSSSGAVEATTAPLESSTTMPAESSSEGAATSSDSGVAESSEGTTGNATVCDPPLTQSACGNPNSIVRGTATVGDGAPTTGTLLLALTHQYLGDGASGGIYHISATIPAVDFAAGPVPFELDMCAGGEMWSEENCEFQISVALDANDNGVIDAGDPTGKQFVFVSCTGDNPCLELALDCTDGTSCVAFPDPGYCACPGNGQVCNSPIVAC
ncbi:MAG TPA: hypothetical protein VG755_05370 [Nannocystaceae bacterium]|nr:hypothetical protein [Nannocystaceae bacterium]